ncbi:hypothetical protein EDEG_02415 [Edhazardia aedis USNM 41457]|uniref:Uncharacterized protein n=1 Tax=Edhazardia aedis (strain USNM 41457) TaxID=1003232 RepID=J9DKT1_EDHAE|nr:hypothetical protein EDEG_02415 [Edhazardia aedis USNM 41457]|eukprot:EJW03200.1 hypothetical protein EDEG_02415 [Edhazardia aedis USNM 41457]
MRKLNVCFVYFLINFRCGIVSENIKVFSERRDKIGHLFTSKTSLHLSRPSVSLKENYIVNKEVLSNKNIAKQFKSSDSTEDVKNQYRPKKNTSILAISCNYEQKISKHDSNVGNFRFSDASQPKIPFSEIKAAFESSTSKESNTKKAVGINSNNLDVNNSCKKAFDDKKIKFLSEKHFITPKAKNTQKNTFVENNMLLRKPLSANITHNPLNVVSDYQNSQYMGQGEILETSNQDIVTSSTDISKNKVNSSSEKPNLKKTVNLKVKTLPFKVHIEFFDIQNTIEEAKREDNEPFNDDVNEKNVSKQDFYKENTDNGIFNLQDEKESHKLQKTPTLNSKFQEKFTDKDSKNVIEEESTHKQEKFQLIDNHDQNKISDVFFASSLEKNDSDTFSKNDIGISRKSNNYHIGDADEKEDNHYKNIMIKEHENQGIIQKDTDFLSSESSFDLINNDKCLQNIEQSNDEKEIQDDQKKINSNSVVPFFSLHYDVKKDNNNKKIQNLSRDENSNDFEKNTNLRLSFKDFQKLNSNIMHSEKIEENTDNNIVKTELRNVPTDNFKPKSSDFKGYLTVISKKCQKLENENPLPINVAENANLYQNLPVPKEEMNETKHRLDTLDESMNIRSNLKYQKSEITRLKSFKKNLETVLKFIKRPFDKLKSLLIVDKAEYHIHIELKKEIYNSDSESEF